ncbi:sulfite exporter TauE/SafE family protein [Shewanella eurypsychrophilus]|uniref:Probable membrane transporter protein n=1 Tax=Shewanella eurypsychrophilus TaxID=2593656 RepID=A0ABX6V6U1_9GAMM|nr:MULTISPECIES: sulfite exporter TauE/SafE family protein [Shewanella]QPG58344.2 sulfite exporter TauE/SafE family protein [Shewanella eurypsychrophilus]
MELTFEFWYLLPIATVIATIAMSSGIGGAVFFSPLFMIALSLEPKIAIGAALATELAGFSSGLYAYLKARLIDFQLAKKLLVFSIPAALIGSLYADLIPAIVLKAIFAVGLVFIGTQLFSAWRKEEREKNENTTAKEFEENYQSELTDSQGNVYRYTICNPNMGKSFAAIGGAFVGMISVGLAELQEYHLVARCKVPTPVAIGTSIFVVVLTVLTASIGHFYEFYHQGNDVLAQVVNIIIFTIPGVIIGGQLGPKLQRIVPEDKMKAAISIAFLLIGIFMLYTLI